MTHYLNEPHAETHRDREPVKKCEKPLAGSPEWALQLCREVYELLLKPRNKSDSKTEVAADIAFVMGSLLNGEKIPWTQLASGAQDLLLTLGREHQIWFFFEDIRLTDDQVENIRKTLESPTNYERLQIVDITRQLLAHVMMLERELDDVSPARRRTRAATT